MRKHPSIFRTFTVGFDIPSVSSTYWTFTVGYDIPSVLLPFRTFILSTFQTVTVSYDIPLYRWHLGLLFCQLIKFSPWAMTFSSYHCHLILIYLNVSFSKLFLNFKYTQISYFTNVTYAIITFIKNLMQQQYIQDIIIL